MFRLSSEDIETLAELTLKRLDAYPDRFKSVDIEEVIRRDGYKVEYRKLSDYGEVLGVTSLSGNDAEIHVDGVTEHIYVSPSSIILDTSLKQSRQSGRKRFTQSHEYAHHVSDDYEQSYCELHGLPFDRNRIHYLRSDKRKDAIDEYQTNLLCSCILMPRHALGYAVYMLGITEPIVIYGNDDLYRRDYKRICDISSVFKVSKAALMIRMLRLGLAIRKPMSEFDPIMANIGW